MKRAENYEGGGGRGEEEGREGGRGRDRDRERERERAKEEGRKGERGNTPMVEPMGIKYRKYIRNWRERKRKGRMRVVARMWKKR